MLDISIMPDTDTFSKPVANGSPRAVEAISKHRNRKVNTLPSISPSSEMTKTSYEVLIDGTPTAWTELPCRALFSMSPDGSFPFIKMSKSSYADLRTLVVTTGVHSNGRVYRVYL